MIKTLRDITKVLMLTMLLISSTSKVHCMNERNSQSICSKVYKNLTAKNILKGAAATVFLGGLGYLVYSNFIYEPTYTVRCVTNESTGSWWWPWGEKGTLKTIESVSKLTREAIEETISMLRDRGHKNCTIIRE